MWYHGLVTSHQADIPPAAGTEQAGPEQHGLPVLHGHAQPPVSGSAESTAVGPYIPFEAPPLTPGDRSKFFGGLVLAGGVLLFVFPIFFDYPHTSLGNVTHGAVITISIVMTLCGLWQFRSSRPDTFTSTVSGFAAFALLLTAIFAASPGAVNRGFEFFAAIIGLIGSGGHWLNGEGSRH